MEPFLWLHYFFQRILFLYTLKRFLSPNLNSDNFYLVIKKLSEFKFGRLKKVFYLCQNY